MALIFQDLRVEEVTCLFTEGACAREGTIPYFGGYPEHKGILTIRRTCVGTVQDMRGDDWKYIRTDGVVEELALIAFGEALGCNAATESLAIAYTCFR